MSERLISEHIGGDEDLSAPGGAESDQRKRLVSQLPPEEAVMQGSLQPASDRLSSELQARWNVPRN